MKILGTAKSKMKNIVTTAKILATAVLIVVVGTGAALSSPMSNVTVSVNYGKGRIMHDNQGNVKPMRYSEQKEILTKDTDLHIISIGTPGNCIEESWILPIEYANVEQFLYEYPDAQKLSEKKSITPTAECKANVNLPHHGSRIEKYGGYTGAISKDYANTALIA